MGAQQYIKNENVDKSSKEDLEKDFIRHPDKPRSIISINTNLELYDTEIEVSNNIADIELINDSIYFTTYNKDEIKRYDFNQEKVDIVPSNILQTALEKADKNREVQKQALSKQLGFLSVPAVLSFIWLLISSKPVTSSFKEATGLFRHNKKMLDLDKTSAPDLIYSSERIYIPFRRQQREKLKKFAIYLLMTVYFICLIMFFYSLGKEQLLKLLNNKGFIFLVVFWPYYFYHLKKIFTPKKLFIEDGFLYWQKSPQKTYQFELESLVYSRLSFADRHVTVFPNLAKQQVYDEEAFVNHALPIIKQGKYLNELQFALHYLKHQFGDILIHIIFFGGIILLS